MLVSHSVLVDTEPKLRVGIYPELDGLLFNMIAFAIDVCVLYVQPSKGHFLLQDLSHIESYDYFG